MAHAAEAARFTVANRSPLSGVIGVPSGWNSTAPSAAELSWDMASHSLGYQSDGSAGPAEVLSLDGETHAVTLRLRHALTDRLSLAVELPWLGHSGGFLDRAIDDWHDAFGLREGIRPSQPTNELRFLYARGGVTSLAVTDDTSGVGDLRTGIAWQLLQRPGLQLAATGEVKWPTGDAGRLTGSGGTDVSAGLRAGSSPDGDSRLGWSLAGGWTWPGDTDAPLPPATSGLGWYDASLSWRALAPLDLVLQLQGQDGAYRSDLKPLGSSALQFGGGFHWRLGRGYTLLFAIVEDIRPDTAPDFSAQLGLRWAPAVRTN
jgi:hypothetical protein